MSSFYLVVVLLGLAFLAPELIEFFVPTSVVIGERSAIQSVTAIKAAQET